MSFLPVIQLSAPPQFGLPLSSNLPFLGGDTYPPKTTFLVSSFLPRRCPLQEFFFTHLLSSARVPLRRQRPFITILSLTVGAFGLTKFPLLFPEWSHFLSAVMFFFESFLVKGFPYTPAVRIFLWFPRHIFPPFLCVNSLFERKPPPFFPSHFLLPVAFRNSSSKARTFPLRSRQPIRFFLSKAFSPSLFREIPVPVLFYKGLDVSRINFSSLSPMANGLFSFGTLSPNARWHYTITELRINSFVALSLLNFLNFFPPF